jgi:hypothetical protein
MAFGSMEFNFQQQYSEVFALSPGQNSQAQSYVYKPD